MHWTNKQLQWVLAIASISSIPTLTIPISSYAKSPSPTLKQNKNGQYYVYQGNSRLKDYYGIAKYKGNYYKCAKGKYDKSFQGFAPYGKNWWWFQGGMIRKNVNNLRKGTVKGKTAWWKVTQGKVDTKFSGLAQSAKNNQYYVVKKGAAQLNYNSNHYLYQGKYYQVQKGKVIGRSSTKNPTALQLYKLSNGQFVYKRNGKPYASYTGEIKTKQYGTLLVQKGYVTGKFTGVLRTKSGIMHYFQKSRLSSYTGILNVNGKKWLFIKGIQQTAWNGTVTQNGKKYLIRGGQVVTPTKTTVAYETGNFVDISKHNGTINFNTMKQTGVNGVMMRAAYEYTEDSKFEENSHKAEQAGLDYGVYQFGTFHYNTTTKVQAMEQARNQANSLLQFLKGKHVTGYVALDLENENPSKFTVYLSPDDLTDVANYWMSIIKNAGYKPMLYCSVSWLKNQMNVNRISVPLWVAYYGSNADQSNAFLNTTWGQYMTSIKDKIYFWQYSSNGDLANYGGTEGRIDLNYSYRSFTGKVIQI